MVRRQGLPFPSSRIFPPSVLEGRRQNFLNKYNQRCQHKDVSHGTLMTCLLREYAQFLRKCTYKFTSTSLSQTISYDGTRNLAWTHQLQTHLILRLPEQRAVYRTDIPLRHSLFRSSVLKPTSVDMSVPMRLRDCWSGWERVQWHAKQEAQIRWATFVYYTPLS